MIVTAFRKFAIKSSNLMGSPQGFALGLLCIVVWAATHTLNTGATLATYLMVFVLQYAQNRSWLATNVKLDAILEALAEARNEAICVENEEDERMQDIQQEIRDQLNS